MNVKTGICAQLRNFYNSLEADGQRVCTRSEAIALAVATFNCNSATARTQYQKWFSGYSATPASATPASAPTPSKPSKRIEWHVDVENWRS